MLRAPITITQGLSTYSARSEFTTESGAITGDSLLIGGTWGGAGDADDASVSAGVCTRTAVSDTGQGRFFTAGATTFTDVAGQIDMQWSALASQVQSILLQYTDTSNYLTVNVQVGGDGRAQVYGEAYIAGSPIGVFGASSYLPTVLNTWYTLRAVRYASGWVAAWFGPQGSTPTSPSFIGFSSNFATGGTLASGKAGFRDWATAATACTRTYDSYALWVPSPDAVAFASQSLELNWRGITREDAGGTAYGPVSIVNGDLPRMPNRSSAGTVEFVGKLSRGDMQTMPDPGVDDLSVRVYRCASHLLLPS